MTSKTRRALDRVLDPQDVLRVAKLEPDDLVARHGWSNQAWIGSRYVVRISSGRLDGALDHERRMVDLVAPAGVPVAPVLASGQVRDLPGARGEAGEWLVSRRLPGDTLAETWPRLDDTAREVVGRQLGAILRAIHSIEVGPVAPRWWEAAHHAPLLRNAYRPRVSLGRAMVAAVRDLARADQGLLDDTEAMLRERQELFDGDALVLVHADIHGHNLLTDERGGALSGVLDWEGAHTAAADVELDMLVRWTAAAHAFPERPGRPSPIAPGDAIRLVADVGTEYPELFAGPHLAERLEVYDALWHLVQLLFDGYWAATADDRPYDDDGSPSWDRLRALIDGRSHIRDLAL